MKRLIAIIAAVAALALAASSAAGANTPARASTSARGSANGQVVLSHGQSLEIALVLDPYELSDISASIGNAVQMAEQLTPAIKGFRVQLVDHAAPCFSDDAVEANAAVASAVVSDPHTVAVIGPLCSVAFSGIPDPDASPCESPSFPNALSIYETAGVPTINGSTTGDCLPSVGPTVFNRTAVADPDFDAWYSQVKALPLDILWRSLYELRFGAPPTDFADLYFDATNVLLTRIAKIAHVQDGRLVIDRAKLAAAIRATTLFPGVTGSITIDPVTGNRVP
jgi:hypothetical protein